jgi:hypothetical protein
MSFDMDKIADRLIAEAIEQGKFDNLDGKGRPLKLEEDPLTPPHLRLANCILKNANVLPDFVQMDVDIRALREECEQILVAFARDYDRKRAEEGSDRFTEWYAGIRSAYLKALKSHNQAILKYNLAAPNSPTVHMPFDIRDETDRFDTAFPAHEKVQASVQPADQKVGGVLRDSAAAFYAAGQLKGS